MASQLHSLPTRSQTGMDEHRPAFGETGGFKVWLTLRSAENDLLMGVILLATLVMVPIIYFGEVNSDAWRTYEPPPRMDSPIARSVHILVATQTPPKEEEAPKVEPPKPPPAAPLVVVSPPEPAPPVVAKVMPPPKVKRARKRKPARKTKVRRQAVTKPKAAPAKTKPEGNVQRIMSKGDTPSPTGPTPSNLAQAGTGAATDGPSTPPAAGDPKGSVDGVGSAPATAPPAIPSIDLDKLRRKYVRRVGKAVRRDFKYPRAASRVGMEGKVIVAITIDADGNIIGAKITKSSGFDILDSAAVAAAKSVHRVPKPPAELHWQRRRVKVPFTFRLRSS